MTPSGVGVSTHRELSIQDYGYFGGYETDSAKLSDWLQVTGLFGVIISLVFVGLEIQQSRQIAIADIYQQRAEMIVQVNSIRLTSENLHETRRKLEAGETLTNTEQSLLDQSWNPYFNYVENNHFQYQLGLLSEEQWISTRNNLRSRARDPLFLAWWEVERENWRESFAQEVDELIKEEKASFDLITKLPDQN